MQSGQNFKQHGILYWTLWVVSVLKVTRIFPCFLSALITTYKYQCSSGSVEFQNDWGGGGGGVRMLASGNCFDVPYRLVFAGSVINKIDIDKHCILNTMNIYNYTCYDVKFYKKKVLKGRGLGVWCLPAWIHPCNNNCLCKKSPYQAIIQQSSSDLEWYSLL